MTSWKEIAAYLKRDVRTVQRWEVTRGLPVHRLPGSGRSPIYALRSQLDEWWVSTPARLDGAAVELLPEKKSPNRRWWLASVVLPAVAAVAVWLLPRPTPTPAPLPVVPLTSLPGAEYAPALSPDGKRLAFTRTPADSQNRDIYVIDLPDGAPRRITSHPAADVFPEWSPDGQQLAYARVTVGADWCEMRIADLHHGTDRGVFISPIPGVDTPAWTHVWSPDGKALILSWPRRAAGPFGIARMDLKTGTEQSLTPPVAGVVGERTPSLSPDGRRLVFQRRTVAAEGDLFVIDLGSDCTAAGPPRQITHEKCCLEAPSWTRDGREIVFVSWKDGTRRLARVHAEGGPVRFDPTVPSVGQDPRIAPDGRLLFHNLATVGNIFRVDLKDPAAGTSRLIASTRHDGSPVYSPDGRRIVFVSDRGGSRQLWTSDSEGGEPRQLTRLKGVTAWYPSYSPGGRWIAFEGRQGRESDIYLADASTGDVKPLLSDKSAEQRPAWSHDGRRLYFASDRTGRYEVWHVPVDGGGNAGAPVQLTRLGGYSGIESPDGRYYYYANNITMKQLCRVPAAGGPEEAVAGKTQFNRYPANLTAGARSLYYLGQSNEQGTPVWLLPFAGGAPRLVAAEHRIPSPFGIAVSPDERWLLLSLFEQTAGDILSVPGFR